MLKIIENRETMGNKFKTSISSIYLQNYNFFLLLFHFFYYFFHEVERNRLFWNILKIYFHMFKCLWDFGNVRKSLIICLTNMINVSKVYLFIQVIRLCVIWWIFHEAYEFFFFFLFFNLNPNSQDLIRWTWSFSSFKTFF